MAIDVVNGRRAWGVAALLFVFSMVNFFDKLVMGLSAVPLMREFGLTPSQYGALGGSFFFLYAIAGVLVGVFVVPRVSPKLLLLALVGIWTLSQIPMVFGASLGALYAGRILLGVGEGPATPAAYHTLYGWFTSERRNVPTSLLLAGVGAGFLVGSPALTHVIAAYGWRSAFMVCGLAGITWMLAWAIFGKDGPLIQRRGAAAVSTELPVPWGQIWSDPTIIASIGIASCCYWIVGLSITWLAPYLQLGLGYSPRDTGWLVSVILGTQVVTQVGLAYISDRMLLAGKSSRLSRGVLNGACVLVAGVAVALATIVDAPVAKVALLTLTFTLPLLTFVIGPAIVAEVVPTPQRGTALLVIYSVMTVTGLLSPIVTGWAVQAAGANAIRGYTQALWLTSAVLILGGVWGLLYLNPEATRARLARSEPSITPALRGSRKRACVPCCGPRDGRTLSRRHPSRLSSSRKLIGWRS